MSSDRNEIVYCRNEKKNNFSWVDLGFFEIQQMPPHAKV
jgi:hypothetical protein